MLDTYANSAGQIRTGTLLMDLDALAGVVAYKHTGEGVTTVTAAVDRITIKNPIREICDLQLSGQVSFATGRSSMEITLQIAKAPEEGQQVAPEDVFMTCAFTMVALDPNTRKPINIAPLEVTTPAEKALFSKGEENYKRKKAMKSSHILAKAPDAEESSLIHKMWTDSLAYADTHNPKNQPQNVLAMSKTQIHSTQIMQPQMRNRHSKSLHSFPSRWMPDPFADEFIFRLYDLRWFPPQNHLRISIHLCRCLFTYSTEVHQP